MSPEEDKEIEPIIKEVNKMVDKKVVKLFQEANSLQVDEIIIYARAYEEYIDAYDVYRTYYKVVTINERTGHVLNYKQYESKTPVRWSVKGC